MTCQFKRFFSVDSPKAIKAQSYGYLNAINYMAPASTAGVGNLCPHASAGCRALCLGWFSGQAGMVNDQAKDMNDVRRSRVAKAQMFMRNRFAFNHELFHAMDGARRNAKRKGLKLCVRLNGATDIAWEKTCPDIFRANPDVQFVDYTKSLQRALAHARGELPQNYHLTFSRSETNWLDCLKVLMHGGNVAVVFDGPLPPLYRGFTVVNGDKHDLRHLDASGGERKSLIVGLSPKGRRAKADTSGFVVRLAA